MSQSRSKSSGARSGGHGPVGAARSAQRPRNRAVIVAAVVAVVLIGLFIVYRANSAAGTGAGARGRGRVGPFRRGQPRYRRDGAGVHAARRHRAARRRWRAGDGGAERVPRQKDPAALHALGVDQLLTITSGPLDLVAQKMRDDALTAPALVDTDLRVSTTYQANRYGMMGTSRDGHSFVLVGPDGRIEWRADYGGPPRFTMYVPVEQLAADLRAGRTTP